MTSVLQVLQAADNSPLATQIGQRAARQMYLTRYLEARQVQFQEAAENLAQTRAQRVFQQYRPGHGDLAQIDEVDEAF